MRTNGAVRALSSYAYMYHILLGIIFVVEHERKRLTIATQQLFY